ncbi:MAG: hypothetical protein WCG83_00840 [Candidatus Peregrinibacteria bacterium]
MFTKNALLYVCHMRFLNHIIWRVQRRALKIGRWIFKNIHPAFNGDWFLARRMDALIREQGIQTAVETGTYLGQTTRWLARRIPSVHTIEIQEKFATKARQSFRKFSNIQLHIDNSPNALRELIPKITSPVLFFLDAHWYDYWPILDEIQEIRKSGIRKCIIVIHDFFVPHSDFGFDSYLGQPLDLAYVTPALDEAFGKQQWKYWYNTRATGWNRGVIFIEPLPLENQGEEKAAHKE